MRKGQSHTNEAKEQSRQSKFKRFSKSLNLNLFDKYLDVSINKGSKNRTLEFITPRQFKENIMAGQSLQMMLESSQKAGKKISKHLLKFYSNFAQGKISLSSDQLAEDILNGFSLEEIAKRHQITREDLTFLRQMYQIDNKGPTFQKRKETETPLTTRQKEILYGTLMGDAKSPAPYYSSVWFGQGTNQKSYLLWKYKEFSSVISPNSLVCSLDWSLNRARILEHWRCYTYANSDVEKIAKEFYNGTKHVSEDVLSNLTPLSIAVWYQDDGKTEFSRTGTYKPMAYICTECFSKEDCQKIKEWFKSKYDIACDLQERMTGRVNSVGGDGYRIKFDMTETAKLFQLISPFVLPDFRYKIELADYLIWRSAKEAKTKAEEKFLKNELKRKRKEDDYAI